MKKYRCIPSGLLEDNEQNNDPRVYRIEDVDPIIAKLEAENEALELSLNDVRENYDICYAENKRLRKALEDIKDISYPADVLCFQFGNIFGKDISYPADVYFIALKALEDK